MNKNRKRHPGNYKKLQRALEQHGYNVEKKIIHEYKSLFSLEINKKKISYTFWRVTGKGIQAGFCTPNRESYISLSGHITADNIECFDKWSKCPFRMKIQNLDHEKLFKELEFLGTPEGLEISDNFDENGVFTYEQNDVIK